MSKLVSKPMKRRRRQHPKASSLRKEKRRGWVSRGLLLETHQFLLREAILKERVSNGPRSPKDNRGRKEDFETVHEEAINFKLESK